MVFEWMEVAVGCVDEFARPAERDLTTIAAIRINTISSASGTEYVVYNFDQVYSITQVA